MARNKFEFLKQLLDDKRVKPNQRERIIELASNEISTEGSLEERVQKIESILFDEDSLTEIEQNITLIPQGHSISLPKYFNPYHLYRFLFEYNQNPVLRSTCHDIDSGAIDIINEYCSTDNYNFSIHLKHILQEYTKHEEKHKAPGHSKALIRAYLTGKKYDGSEITNGWSSSNIKIHWSSQEILDWASEHPKTPPNLNQQMAGDKEIELPAITPQIISPISYDSVQNFTQLVLHFKNLIHIRSGSQSLKAIIDRVNESRQWKKLIDINFSENLFLNNLEHFTDIDKLLQSYDEILKLIIQQNKSSEKPQVELKYYEENKSIYFSINHTNGTYNKTLQNTIDRHYGQTYTSIIRNQINGLCNLYLRANFGNNQFAEINLWNGQPVNAKNLTSFAGVEHTLEFPKN